MCKRREVYMKAMFNLRRSIYVKMPSVPFLGTICRGWSRGRVQGVRIPPPPKMTGGFLIQLLFCKKKKKTIWFIDVEVEQETSATPPKKNSWSAPDMAAEK